MSIEPLSISFNVLGSHSKVPTTPGWAAYLFQDNWDDWGKYCTQFYLYIVDPEGDEHGIGSVKIGKRGLKPFPKLSDLPPDSQSSDPPPGYRTANIPSKFAELGEEFFSVGQDGDYYDNLKGLGDEIRERVLFGLRDVAFDKERWGWAKEEDVMGESLLRSVTASTVVGQFRRMAHGDARLTPYRFSYSPPKRFGDGSPPFTLTFNVNPESWIPTNVHVLIGQNGVGKTRLLSLMTKALVAKDATARQSGKFELNERDGNVGTFANLVSVSFSAFDKTDPLPDQSPATDAIGFSFIGLIGTDKTSKSIKPKSLNMLAREFVKSLRECRIGARKKRWIDVMTILQTDSVFKSYQLISMIDQGLSESELLEIFKKLSSGHKIALLTLTRLVEKVEERTLVLIDELEAHLHPPLLSATTRAISELMAKRNGVAIVATHSPVILQEVPKSCVWILNSNLTISKAERPTIETFAENISILSREVFKLELTKSGYHNILHEIYNKENSYDDAIFRLGERLGAEGKAVLRAMYLDAEE